MRQRSNQILLVFVILLTAFSVYVVWPSAPKQYFPSFLPLPRGGGLSIGNFQRKAMRLGLDLRGGVEIVVQADPPPGFDPKNLDGAMKTAQQIYENRVNGSGLNEAQVTRQGSNRIVTDIPGITIDQANNLIGKTAQLLFKEPQINPQTQAPATDSSGQTIFIPACQDYGCPNGEQPLTGKDLKPNAFVGQDQIGQPDVNFNLTAAGAKKFGAITLRNINKPVAIYLDNQQISAPIVNSQITDSGQITGPNLNASTLVAQLNAGALPLPFTVVSQSTVDATLGKDSVQKSVFAGEIGFLAVAFFMIVFYRLPGVLATLALTIYSFVVLMIFKIVPVTLTLPGIAAFVLSIGIAVDANILIFERTKEELRAGRGLNAAIDAGFRRAWPSIRDSNASTIMTSLILYWFGDQFGAALVKGFALNLAIGVIISLFSAILITRLFLHLMVGTRLGRGRFMFGAQRPQYAQRAEEVTPRERTKLPGILNLVGNRKWYFIISAIIMVPGLISLGVFHLKPGIEFTSGTTFSMRFQQPPSEQQFIDTARTFGFGDPTVTVKGNDYTVQFAQAVTPQALQNKLSGAFSITDFKQAGNGASFVLKTPPSAADVRSELKSQGFADARVQGASNNEFEVRIKALAGNVTTSDVGPAQPSALDGVRNALVTKFGHLTDTNNHVTDRLINSDTVSSIVSSEIVKKAALAVVAASVAILLYITFAFHSVKNPFRFGVTAIIALLHDVIVVVGLFSIFGVLFNTEVDTMFLTGLLTVIGFSVHDTIVVFDRIRENQQRGISRDFDVTVNESLLQTLDRSLGTSLTVVFTLLALLLLGGVTIQSFVLVLLIGIISGTYSSIAIASQLLVEWEHHNPGPYVGRFFRKLGFRRRERRPALARQPQQPVV